MASNVESALPQEVFELQLQLGETYERDRAAMAVQGKTLDHNTWMLGMPIDPKYPGGAPYLAIEGETSLMDLTSKIQASTWGWTAVGAAFTYAAGHKHAHKIGMTGLRGHRFGFILSIPIFFLGWSNGVHDQLQRFQGLKPNGRPARFPQYKSDLVPYFVKHKVTTRVVLSPDQEVTPRTLI